MDKTYSYPHTRYSDASLSQLHSTFSSAQWRSLSIPARLDACQEVANRYAAEQGKEAPVLTCENMSGSTYGWASGNTICLNSNLLLDGQFVGEYTDQQGNSHEYIVSVPAENWQILDTVYHETDHYLRSDTSYYIAPGADRDLYRMQNDEKLAYAAGSNRTLSAIAQYEKETGKLDANREAYFSYVKSDTFQNALINASVHYNDPNIDQTLNDVIQDRTNGATRKEPSPSYQAINKVLNDYEQKQAQDQNKDQDQSQNQNQNQNQGQEKAQDMGQDQDTGQANTADQNAGAAAVTTLENNSDNSLNSGNGVDLDSTALDNDNDNALDSGNGVGLDSAVLDNDNDNAMDSGNGVDLNSAALDIDNDNAMDSGNGVDLDAAALDNDNDNALDSGNGVDLDSAALDNDNDNAMDSGSGVDLDSAALDNDNDNAMDSGSGVDLDSAVLDNDTSQEDSGQDADRSDGQDSGPSQEDD